MSYVLVVKPTYLATSSGQVPTTTTNDISSGLQFASEEEALRIKRACRLSSNWEVLHIDDALAREAARHSKIAEAYEPD